MIYLTDCTLRDGGYYTNWDFDDDLIQTYFGCIDILPIEYVEVGYRSYLKKGYLGEYFYLPLATLNKVRKLTSKKLSIMLNEKDLEGVSVDSLLSNIKPYISMVRIATSPANLSNSIEIAKYLKNNGFEVAINLMYISQINPHHESLSLISEINGIVDVLNLVDSYGAIYPEELKKVIIEVRNNTSIPLGFHGHNNLELAFSNTLKAIECGVTYIDCTVTGMGRGAGNLKTELILAHLNSKKNAELDLNCLATLTETFSALQSKYRWGTNLAYMVSGSYSLPQKQVMDAFAIDRYSLSGIVNQLQKTHQESLDIFSESSRISECLIIGGGLSVLHHFQAINTFLENHRDILVIHSTSRYTSNFRHLSNKQYFAVSGDEILKSKKYDNIQKYILEPSPRKTQIADFKNSNYYELNKITFIDKHSDSPFTIALQIALDIRTSNTLVVGFDGYSDLKNKKELYLMLENQEIIDAYLDLNCLTSLTPTKYKNLHHSSIYGINL